MGRIRGLGREGKLLAHSVASEAIAATWRIDQRVYEINTESTY